MGGHSDYSTPGNRNLTMPLAMEKQKRVPSVSFHARKALTSKQYVLKALPWKHNAFCVLVCFTRRY
jgi:hypothetical protein